MHQRYYQNSIMANRLSIGNEHTYLSMDVTMDN